MEGRGRLRRTAIGRAFRDFDVDGGPIDPATAGTKLRFSRITIFVEKRID